MKPLVFLGDSLARLRNFPVDARQDAGHQLFLVQTGRDPSDWKPLTTAGPGVKEIRVRNTAGTFRVIYIATLADAIYVLHCFQKKTQGTEKRDLELAARRYRQLTKGST